MTLAAGLAVLTAPRVADACEWPIPEITETIPPEGGTHPANAGVALFGDGLWATQVSATIDQNPVDVIVDGELSVTGFWAPSYYVLVLRTDPPPEPGQVVHIFGDTCYDFGDEDQCVEDNLDLTYTAGEPDNTPPPAPIGVSIDTYNHGEVTFMSTPCGGSEDLQYALYVDADFEIGEEPTLKRISWRPEDNPDAIQAGIRTWKNPYPVRETWLEPPQLLPIMAGEVCGVAKTLDLAGNSTGWLESCDVCRDQVGPDCDEPPCFALGFPSYDCDSIVHWDACLPRLVEDCEQPIETTGGSDSDGMTTGDTTGGDSTTGGSTTSTTTDPSTTTTDPSATSTTDPSTTSTTQGSGATASETGDSATAATPTDSETDAVELDPNSGCACSSRGTAGGGSVLALLLLLTARRRRDGSQGCSPSPQ